MASHPRSFRDGGLLVAYLVLIAAVFYDVHTSQSQVDKMHHLEQIGVVQRQVIVHNQGIIIHNQQVLCMNQVRLAGTVDSPAASCQKIRTDYTP